MDADDHGRLAFDIETVNAPRPDGVEFDAQNSEHVEFFCVCVAYQSASSEAPDHEVIFRRDTGPEAELDVIEETITWLEEKPTETVITYNGDDFDWPHLEGRALLAAEELGERFEVHNRARQLVDSVNSIDLMTEACEAFAGGDRISFEDTCEEAGVDVTYTHLDEYDLPVDPILKRPTWKGIEPVVKGCDVPVIGERYLNLCSVGRTDLPGFDAMHDALEHYATTDVVPLFELADSRPFVEATAD